jgi:broad specificity phosphatase PhoE
LARQEPSLIARVLADRAAVIVASDMVRARESAALLAPGAPELTSPLLREVDLPIPGWLRWLRAPVGGWIVLSRMAWMMGATEPGPSAESFRAALARAGEAAGWLAGLAAQRGDVLAVTHGGFRRLLAPALCRRGWRGRAWPISSPNWSSWTLEAPEPLRRSATLAPPPARTAE